MTSSLGLMALLVCLASLCLADGQVLVPSERAALVQQVGSSLEVGAAATSFLESRMTIVEPISAASAIFHVAKILYKMFKLVTQSLLNSKVKKNVEKGGAVPVSN